MGTKNKVVLRGNLGQDPEVKHLQNGGMLANLSMATSESWKDKQTGERKERTQWHRVVVWNEGIVKVIEKYLKKGDQIEIEGQLETRKWQDQNGQDRYSTEVVLRPYKSDLDIIRCKAFENKGSTNQSSSFGGGNTGVAGSNGGRNESRDMDDEIPF